MIRAFDHLPAPPLPSGWSIKRLGDLVDLVNGHPFRSEDFAPQGDVPLVRIRDLTADEFEVFVPRSAVPRRALLEQGDVVVGMDGDFNVVVWGRGPAALNQRLCVLRPRAGTDHRFVAYALPALLKVVNDLTFSTTVKHLSSADVLDQRLPVPAAEEQRRIADFLDTETARLDGLTNARTRQLDSLQERALAVLADQISGRDDRGSRMSTGWPWMPDLPAAWAIGPVFGYFDVQLGKMLNQERASGRHQRPYLRNANVHWYDIDAEDLAEMSFEPEERSRYRVKLGDLLICEGGAGVAEAAVWQGNVPEIYFQKSLHRCRPIRDLPSEWLMHWLRLAKDAGVFAADGNLATIPHLTGEQLRSYQIPIPTDGPHRLMRIRDALARIDDATGILAKSIALMKERSQALITAAVTGQLDVTTARGGRS